MKARQAGKTGAVFLGASLALGIGSARKENTELQKAAEITILPEAEAGQRGNVFWFSYNSGFYRLCSPIQAFGSYYQGYNYGLPASFYGYNFAPHILYQQFTPYAMIQQAPSVTIQNNYSRFGLDRLEPPIPNAGEPSMGEKIERQLREQAEQLKEQNRLIREQGKKLDELTRNIGERKESNYIYRTEDPRKPETSQQLEGKKRHRIEVRYIGHICDVQLDDVATGDVYNPILGFLREESGGAKDIAAYDEGWKGSRCVIAFKSQWSGRRHGEIDISDAFGRGITGPEYADKLLQKMKASQVLGEFSGILDGLEIGFRQYSCGQN